MEIREEREEKVKHLKVLRISKGWRILQDHLQKLLAHREKVKSGLLRETDLGRMEKARYEQGFIDGLSAQSRELDKMLTVLDEELKHAKA